MSVLYHNVQREASSIIELNDHVTHLERQKDSLEKSLRIQDKMIQRLAVEKLKEEWAKEQGLSKCKAKKANQDIVVSNLDQYKDDVDTFQKEKVEMDNKLAKKKFLLVQSQLKAGHYRDLANARKVEAKEMKRQRNDMEREQSSLVEKVKALKEG